MRHSPLSLLILLLVSCSSHRPAPEYEINRPARSLSVSSSAAGYGHMVKFARNGTALYSIYYKDDGSLLYRQDFRYDSLGRAVEMIRTNAAGESEMRMTDSYSGEFLRERTIYGMNNQDLHRWVHHNDGIHVVRTDYYSEGELLNTIFKEYDGPVCRETAVDCRTGDTVSVAVSESLTPDKVLYVKSETNDYSVEYDESGLPVRSTNTLIDPEGRIMWDRSLETRPVRCYRYVFDRYGNWIERIESDSPDGAATDRVVRKIRY